MSEQLTPNPNYYIPFKTCARGVKIENSIPLPVETPPEWMKKLHALISTFDLIPPLISNLEVFEHSSMSDQIVQIVIEYEKAKSDHDTETARRILHSLPDEIINAGLGALEEKFSFMQGDEADLVQPEHHARYYLTKAESNSDDKMVARLNQTLDQAGINNPAQRAKNISAYFTLYEMGLSLFNLLTGTTRPEALISGAGSPLNSLEKALFQEAPVSFLSSAAYLMTVMDTVLSIGENEVNKNYASELYTYLIRSHYYPIIKAITTMEFAETSPADAQYGSYHLSQLSRFMTYLSDMYYNNLLIQKGIFPPSTTSPILKKKLLDRLTGRATLTEANSIIYPYDGLILALEKAGLPETLIYLRLLTRLNKASIQSTFKSGFRTMLDEHPTIINYFAQLSDLDSKRESDITDLPSIYLGLLESKLSRAEYRELAADPRFYLKTRNLFKFRLVIPDGILFDEMVKSIARDLVQESKDYKDAPLAKDAPQLLEWREKVRANQSKHLKGVFTLFVNKSAITKVVPFDAEHTEFYRQMVDGSPTEIINKQFEGGGRAMFFVRFNLPVSELNFPVELQIVPESVEKYLHRQRENYLMGRIYGYFVTPELIKEFMADEPNLGNYVV